MARALAVQAPQRFHRLEAVNCEGFEPSSRSPCVPVLHAQTNKRGLDAARSTGSGSAGIGSVSSRDATTFVSVAHGCFQDDAV